MPARQRYDAYSQPRAASMRKSLKPGRGRPSQVQSDESHPFLRMRRDERKSRHRSRSKERSSSHRRRRHRSEEDDSSEDEFGGYVPRKRQDIPRASKIKPATATREPTGIRGCSAQQPVRSSLLCIDSHASASLVVRKADGDDKRVPHMP